MGRQTYEIDRYVTDHPHDVHNLRGSGVAPGSADFLDVARQVMLINHVAGGIMQGDDSRVEIEILVNSGSIANVSG
jgi:hypothetical protein